MNEPERTPDGHYIVVNGRRWRATDPSIPASLRQEMVDELMAARRAVRDSDDPEAVAQARLRVNNAKVALGERGHPWWEPPDADAQAARILAAISALLTKRSAASSVCPSEVARVVASPNWRDAMQAVRDVAWDQVRAGALLVTQGAVIIRDPSLASGPVRFRTASP